MMSLLTILLQVSSVFPFVLTSNEFLLRWIFHSWFLSSDGCPSRWIFHEIYISSTMQQKMCNFFFSNAVTIDNWLFSTQGNYWLSLCYVFCILFYSSLPLVFLKLIVSGYCVIFNLWFVWYFCSKIDLKMVLWLFTCG